MIIADTLMPNSGLGLPIVALRLTSALVLAGLIGVERESSNKAAGLRTHMLIGLAACLFTLIALEFLNMPTSEEDRLGMDPTRIIQAITAGVAFLAAGSIITSGGKVRGLTTGASMWLAGAIGLACGTGHVALAGLASVIALIVLYAIRKIMPGHD